jgi:hypothetical protein
MLNKQVTILQADLNNSVDSSPIEIPVAKTINIYDMSGKVTGTKVVYPKSIQIINDCGAELEYNPVLTQEEYNDYVKTPADLVYQRLLKNYTLQTDHSNFPQCYKFLIRAKTETVTSDLIVEFINYGD